jgi:hypothetical protein
MPDAAPPLDPSQKPIRTTVSGRGFTMGVLLLLSVILGGGLPVLLRFHHLQALLDETKQAWPGAMAKWDTAYSAMEQHFRVLAAEPSSGVATQDVEDFEKSLSSFRKYASRQDQLPFAIALESLCKKENFAQATLKDSRIKTLIEEAETSPEMKAYLQAEQNLIDAENGGLGQLCRTILQLPRAEVLRR